ncbi:5-formyltetrahydrofolate cyclo-ligase [Lethenteron reissneri]|uniref:5-formyltetrahydrofolate cyclo-ligase n=1 Tax=Lethenteron reissneri TaxID=7753 RepID=UPI002AB6A396|nr:5-formyltetrahydrofolate cyclo-ligase [Lethenteron reissneri]
MASAVRAAKRALRSEVKAALGAMAPDERGRQQLELTRRVISHPRFLAARRIGIYLSLSDEPDTSAILESAFLRGTACFVPRYAHGAPAGLAGSPALADSSESPAAAAPPPDMELLRVASMEDVLSLPLTPWRIPQPAMDDDSREDAIQGGGLDLLIVPGLAFSRDGRRLGRGKGFYDRFLCRLRSAARGSALAPHPYTLAIAFSMQIHEDIPTEHVDELIDEVLTV